MQALDMTPDEPAPRGWSGTLADLHDQQRFIFDGETIPATCVGEPEEKRGDLVVTFYYDDTPSVHREVQDTRDAQVLLLA
jgi:hypothetical protein